MKNLNRIWVATALFVSLAGILLGCAQKINNEDRWSPIVVENVPSQDRKTILVEEFTGQKCINCPVAAEVLQKIVSANSPNIITISLHAKRTKQTNPALESDLAEACAEKFGVQSVVPGIIINRLPMDNSGLKYSDDRSTWSSLIQRFVNQKATHRLQVKTEAVTGRNISLSVLGTNVSSQSPADNIGLAIWVVEDIYEEQQIAGKVEPHYLHHNVLRGALTNDVSYKIGEKHTVKADLPLTVKEVKNAKIVAYIYNQQTGEIYEACIAPLGTGITPGTGDKGEETPKPMEDKIEFYYDDKPITLGKEFEVNKAKRNSDGIIEFESPAVRISGSESVLKDAVLDVSIDKMNHTGEYTSGLYSVCLGRCMVFDGLKQSYSNPKYTPNVGDVITVHYGLSNAKNAKDTYRIGVSIKSKGEEIGRWTYVFNYDPEHVEGTVPPVTPPGDNPKPEEPTDPIPPRDGTGKSNVVAIEFTGQRCGYCIDKMREMDRSAKDLNPNLILVSIHSSRSYTINNELMLGGNIVNSYLRHCGVQYFPSVFLNNIPFDWENGARDAERKVNQKPILWSTLKVELLEGKRVKVSCKSDPYDESSKASIPTKLNVLFWIVQNKMYGQQANVQGTYEFNHILRGSLNGAWGDSYVLGTDHSQTYNLPPVNQWYPPQDLQPSNRFNLENCEVIAIFLDADTKKFYDAVKVKLK